MKFKIIAIFIFATLLSLKTSAQNYTPNTFNDPLISTLNNANGQINGGTTISFRSALQAANNLGGTHTINVPAGTYNLMLGMITMNDIAQNITIIGAAAATTIINMTTTAQDRILLVGTSGVQPNMILSISGLTIQGGKLIADNYGGGAILAGGPGNSLTLTDCIFQNNTIDPSQAAAGGGAVRYNGGGTLTIDNCTFKNNSNPAGEGGAVNFFLENLAGAGNGSVSITNSTFTNNSVAGVGGAGGGALSIAAQGRNIVGITLSVSVLKNTFTGNAANGATNGGGAMSFTNSFDVGNTWNINYNSIVNNTAAAGPSGVLQSGGSQGNVNATENWWGCNSGPTLGTCDKAAKLANGGTQDVSKWLQLKTSASTSPICIGSPSTITASFLTDNLGNAISSGNLAALVGRPVTFSGVLGTLSAAQPNIQASGTATAIYTATSSGTGSANTVVDNVPAADATAKVNITVTANNTVSAPSATPSLFINTPLTAIKHTTTGATGNGVAVNLPGGVTASWASNILSISGTPTTLGTFDYSIPLTGGCGALNAIGKITVTACLIDLGGEVYNDANGIANGIDGSLVNGPALGLYMTLLSGASGTTQVAVVPVDGTGNYLFTNTAAGTYRLVLGTTAGGSTGKQLPTGWYTIGEGGAIVSGKSSGDGNNDGITKVIISCSSITYGSGARAMADLSYLDIDFGISTTNPLPVTLVDFNAENAEQNVLLKWSTSAETNSSRFEVQRSQNGKDWAIIGSVLAKGESKGAHDYTYLDRQAESGENLYRLRMIDLDGTFSFSRIRIVKMDATRETFIYPNPVEDLLNLRMTDFRGVKSTSITNQAGKEIYRSGPMKSAAIDIKNFPAGAYILLINKSDGTASRYKFVHTR